MKFDVGVQKIFNAGAFVAGFFSVFTVFYFNLRSFNVRCNDLFYYVFFVLCGVAFICGQPIRRQGTYPILFMFVVLMFYSFNIFKTIGISDLYTAGAVKYYFNRIIWLPFYIFIFSLIGLQGMNRFIQGFFWGALFNSCYTLVEYFALFNSIVFDYSFLSKIGISVELQKIEGSINYGLIRPTGVTMDTNYTAAYAGMALVLFEYLKELKIDCCKSYSGVYKLLLLVPIGAVMSRTAILSIIMVVVLSFFMHLLDKKRQVLMPYLFIAAVGLSLLLLAFISTVNPWMFKTIIERFTFADSSSGTRFLYLTYFLEHASPYDFIFGGGSSSSGLLLGDYFDSNIGVWAPESNFLTLLIEQGAVFLVLYCTAIFYVFMRLLKKNYLLSMAFLYVNFVGISYNFLGDRIFWIFWAIFMLFSVSNLKTINSRANQYVSN